MESHRFDERVALALPFAVGLALGLGEIIRDCSLTCNVGFQLAPVAIGAIAILALPLGALRATLSQRLGHLKWQAWTFGLLALSLVVFRAVTWNLLEDPAAVADPHVNEHGLRLTYLLFFVWLGSSLAIVGPDLKETVSLLVAERPRRVRVLAVSAALFVAGGLAGSLVALQGGPLLMDHFGRYEHARDSLMLAMAASLGLAAGVAVWLSRRNAARTLERPSEDAPPRAKLREVFGWLQAVPQYRRMALLILCSAAAETVVFYLFYWVVSLQVPGDDGRSIYFARLYLLLNGATLLVMAFGSNRVIDRLGLALTLALLPFVVIGGLSLWWIYGTVVMLYGLRVAQTAVGDALYDRAIDQMLQLLDGPQAPLARPVLDGVVHRAGQGLASVVLLFATFVLDAPIEAFVVLGIAMTLLWSFMILRTRSILSREPAFETA